MKTWLVALCVASLASLATCRMGWVFTSGYESIVGQVSQTFTCQGRPYGYYADVDNACQVFHVCLPIQDDLGQVVQTAHFSFVCGNQTVFDQETLTCNHPAYAFPCDQAQSIYDSRNSLFGRVDEQF
ncbi:U-scoloptoxin(01)-Cw1a-like [Cherax quadricarinatus]|uniref:U-scoloptoxin(01)-Cw1a-like n=1 Tax=Cherax quadricarinatus TaxID=27406 RepID=UPI002377E014|nr:U-scoloptoxin(01)-Cw1a-like [Cherax quadricarinatus]